eukprot:GILI01004433.1.p1 GENE.GILI01004433.1~~GILI01004433.1.p1  ORF type:complete len:562 (+),score=101.56 GILI01004433.1:152-1687(+)
MAADYCPSGTIAAEGLSVNLTTAGEDYSATACNVAAGAIITIDASVAPSGSGATITASFSDGTIGEAGGIEFVGPLADVAGGLNPFSITIRNNIFSADAAIRLFGSLPPNSQVTVDGNTLSISKAIFSDITAFEYAAPIYLFEYQQPFQLSENSGYSIVNNDVKCYDESGAFACYGIGLWSTLHMKANSWLNVSHNTVAARGSDAWWADGIDGMKDIYIEGEGTRIAIDYNNITMDKGSGLEPPLIYTDEAHNNDIGNFTTTVTICHNSFTGYPDPEYPEAVYIEQFILYGRGQYNVSDNYIEVWGVDARLSLNGQVNLFANSRFNIERNVIISHGGTPQINTRAGGWVLNGDSKLWIYENHLHRADNSVPNRPFFQFDYRFMLMDRARAYILNNNLTAVNTSRSYYIAGSTTSTYVYKADAARIKVCYNTYFGNPQETDAQLNVTLTQNLFTLTDSVVYCWDQDPPTTTFPPSTTEEAVQNPGDDSGAGAIPILAAALVSVVASIAMMGF